MSIRRDYHWTDLEVHVNPDRTRRRQRRIKNWQNFRRPDSNNINRLLNFEGTDDNEQPTQNSAPDHWMGNFDFKYQLLKQPLQVFLGDSTTPQNTALWGMRRANNPRAWVNFKAIGVNNSVSMEVFGPQRAVRWQNLWNNSTLWLQATRHKVTKQIRLSTPGHPVSFRFVMRISEGYSYEIIDNQILIKDESGTVQLKTRPPYGWDSATTGLSPDGSQHIRATLTETNPVTIGGRTLPTFLVTPNADDLASAIYPVFIDPDTTITGTAAIEDAMGYSTSADRTYGGTTYMLWGAIGATNANGWVKIQTGDLPEANVIDEFRLDGYFYNARTNMAGETLRARRLLVDWVEGVWNNIVRAAVCWQSRQYYVNDWTSPGAKGAGTDYAIPISEDSIAIENNQSSKAPWSWSFTEDGLDWPRGWKDGDYVNEGFVIDTTNDLGLTKFMAIYSTEGTNPLTLPSFYIKYDETPPSVASAAIFFGSNF